MTINAGLLTAQTNKGNILVGVSSTLNLTGTGTDLMNLGYTSVKYKSDATGYTEPKPDKTFSINLSPKVGYFVADNMALGLDVNMAVSNEKDGENSAKYNQTLFCAGPFVRYYIPTSKVLPFFELSGAYGSLKSKYDSDSFNDTYTSSILAFGGGIGLAAPLGEKVTFDVLAGYNSLILKSKKDNPDNERTIIGTLGLKIGFTFFLGSN